MISFINLTKYLTASKIEKSSYGYYCKSNLFLKVFTVFWIQCTDLRSPDAEVKSLSISLQVPVHVTIFS